MQPRVTAAIEMGVYTLMNSEWSYIFTDPAPPVHL